MGYLLPPKGAFLTNRQVAESEAASTSFYLESLIERGVTREEAVKFTAALVSVNFRKGKGKSK